MGLIMKSFLIVGLFVLFSCAQQMGQFRVKWDYNTEEDINAYQIGIGISADSAYSDSIEYLGFFYHDSLIVSNPDSAVISINSKLDGNYIFAFGAAIDKTGNQSEYGYSNILKKTDFIPPGILKFLNIKPKK